MSTIHKPPPVLACARVLHYAILDSSVRYCGHTSLFVDGKEVGRVPCLAICADARLAEVLLFHCDSEWDVLGCAGYVSADAAKERAERIYPGLSSNWVDTHVTAEEAERYLDEKLGEERCGVCGKRIDQVDEMTEEASGWTCDTCLAQREGR